MSRVRWAWIAAVLLVGCGSSRDVHIDVPPRTLAGQPAEIHVEGLHSDERVEVRARWRSAEGVVWTGAQTVRADRSNRAKTGLRFLSRMRPRGRARSFFELPVQRNRIALSVVDGSDTLARTTLVRDIAPPSVRARELTVAREGIAGAYFVPPHPQGFAVLLLGGSEGGSSSERPVAALLAAHGHPALAIAYFGAPGLPGALRRVPVETVSRGIAWLRRQPAARGHPTAILGVSRGGELALLAASLDPSLARAIIALVPGAYVLQGLPRGPAWTWRGRALPVGNEIPVQHIRGTVLVAGATDDNVWPSGDYADTIAETIAANGSARVVKRIYRGAGHGLATPIPYTPDVADIGLGGSTDANERAREDLWPRILQLIGGS